MMSPIPKNEEDQETADQNVSGSKQIKMSPDPKEVKRRRKARIRKRNMKEEGKEGRRAESE